MKSLQPLYIYGEPALNLQTRISTYNELEDCDQVPVTSLCSAYSRERLSITTLAFQSTCSVLRYSTKNVQSERIFSSRIDFSAPGA
ncbi:hypothetical protein I7I50_12268 [Histoplasma capsulatum G186AR]|uniref:Uncharacterized protein n=1 Tax=Ajellomyces capsulatus TaxID=5037 RepID=A0A8H7YA51_AJECA|nr:hypothetical protein I7I52_11420 [Histoplasma capsulatum]QSS70584.1 hypothetical protein I7I50_12268 [Histoplasma capsulatum G186AR]